MSEQIEKLEEVRALAAEIDRKAGLGVAPRIHDHGEAGDPSLQIGAASVHWEDDTDVYIIGYTRAIPDDEERYEEFDCSRSALTAASIACKLALQIAIDQAAENIGIDRLIDDVEKQE